jgi:hypothetical protein
MTRMNELPFPLGAMLPAMQSEDKNVSSSDYTEDKCIQTVSIILPV